MRGNSRLCQCGLPCRRWLSGFSKRRIHPECRYQVWQVKRADRVFQAAKAHQQDERRRGLR
jgi:hypothetical protein